MEEKALIIADAIQIEETLFFVVQFQNVLSHLTTNLVNTFLQRCNTRIGRFLRRFESNVKLRVISVDMVI